MEFNYRKLRMLQDLFSKEAQFVPPEAMGGGDPSAAAAGGMPPGMDPSMAAGGMDPSMMDPSMAAAGGMDPAMMDPAMAAAGGMPPGMDPSLLAGMPPDAGAASDPGDVSPTGEPYMKITPTQLSKLFKQFAEVFKSVLGIGGQQGGPQMVAQQPSAPAQDPALTQKLTELNAKVDAILGIG